MAQTVCLLCAYPRICCGYPGLFCASSKRAYLDDSKWTRLEFKTRWPPTYVPITCGNVRSIFTKNLWKHSTLSRKPPTLCGSLGCACIWEHMWGTSVGWIVFVRGCYNTFVRGFHDTCVRKCAHSIEVLYADIRLVCMQIYNLFPVVSEHRIFFVKIRHLTRTRTCTHTHARARTHTQQQKFSQRWDFGL